MLDSVGLPIADDNLRFTIQDGFAEFWNIHAGILIVTISIDDDVSAELQTCVNTGSEGDGKALVALVMNDIVGTALAGYLDGSIGAAVINDQDFYAINPLYLPWYISEGCR